MDSEQLASALNSGVIHDPHAHLGRHEGRGTFTVQAWFPGAKRVVLVQVGNEISMAMLHSSGLFAAAVPNDAPYHLRVTSGGHEWTQADPYGFLPTLGAQDQHFIGEGSHRSLYRALGAHPRRVEGVDGVAFAVWAPSARGVGLTGDCNGWQRRSLPMRTLGASGTWELFVPGAKIGDRYKFLVQGADGIEREKADPMAYQAEVRPKTASVVRGLGGYSWADGEWLERRAQTNPYQSPMSIYEVHLGSWRRTADGAWLSYADLARQLAEYCTGMGYTHIELLPVAEHPFDGSWGYQATGFFAPTSRFGEPDDFRAFVDSLHRAGIGVILDWTPAHFPNDAFGLEQFDGTRLYEHEDLQQRINPDWDTYAFNIGRYEVRNFLLANALYWLKEFHIDGLRVDAVSSMLYLDYSRKHGEWTPNRYGGRENMEAIAFFKMFNQWVYSECPGAITIAEESTAWPAITKPVHDGGLGFGFKWNMGWMHDTLSYLARDPVYRKHHQNVLTFSILYAFSENFVLSLSHDEVVHLKHSLIDKMPGDDWQKFANMRLLLVYQHGMPGKKLLFMGGEFGMREEWSHDFSLDWHLLDIGPHRELQQLARDLNGLHSSEPGLHRYDNEPRGFSWLDFSDSANSVLAFVRHGEYAADDIACIYNFTPVPRPGYRVPLPFAGRWSEILNTDSFAYGGSNSGNNGVVIAREEPYNGRPCSVVLTLPPLSAVWLKREADTPV